ncbi:MAG: hypothetical protein ABWZ30_05455 [Jiangellaceae bacterium]
MTQYTAKAVWDEHLWFVQCDQVPGAMSTVSRLSSAVDHQREAISFVADVPIESVDVEVRYELPAKSKTAMAVKVAHDRRLAAIAAQEKSSAASRDAVTALLESGMSTRDAAKILGMSQPRIVQLTKAS